MSVSAIADHVRVSDVSTAQVQAAVAAGAVPVGRTATYDTYRAVRTFSSLDGLRCLAVLAVVWHHSSDPRLHEVLPASRYGFLGVDLFFEISGFLIVTLLLRERERTSRISLRGFYARRAVRIFPLYYGLLAFFAVVYWLRPASAGAAAFQAELPVMACYLSNWIPVSGMFAITWSLAAEEQFYLVWPPLEKWLKRRAVALVLGVIAVSQVIQFGWCDVVLWSWFGWGPDEPAFLRETTFTPICLGVLLAHVLHDPRGFSSVARALGSRLAAPLALFTLFVLCNLLPADIRGSGRPLVHLVMLILLAACLVREDNGLRRLLTWAPLARIGVLSYGIYLLHHAALWISQHLLVRTGTASLPAAGFLLGTAVAVAAAEVSYRFYETPFLRLRGRFR